MSWSVVVAAAEVLRILFIHVRSERYHLLLLCLHRVHDIFEHEILGILRGIQMHGG